MSVLSQLEIILSANSAAFTQAMADARESARTSFGDIREQANKMGPAVGAAAGTAALATAALVSEQITLANELQHTANIANSSVAEIQHYTVAAKKMGIEQETLGTIFQDTNDKIGDFLSTGGGGMADFFENIAPQVGVTAEQFRQLSGPQALQLYYDSLEKANISQNEMTFYLEAVASDASLLIPLLADGGAGFDVWATAAANAGAVMDDETIRATQQLQATTDLLQLSVDGAKNQFVRGFIPVLSDVATQLTGTESASDAAYLAGQNLAVGFKYVAKVGIGVGAVFDAVGSSIGGVAAIVGTLLDGVSLTDGGIVLAIKMAKNIKAAGEINQIVDQDIRSKLLSYGDLLDSTDKLGTGISNDAIDSLIELKKRQAEINTTLGVTGQQYQAQQEAAEAAAKATQKQTKAVKELGAAYVSNNELSNLKIKSNESIAGGKVRGYTAEFAQIAQGLMGNNLKYFSAFNDRYHKGTNSLHTKGQAFDIVLNDAKKARAAVAELKAAAADYGYQIKVLDEYANPSARATGGHLHVSVLGQTAGKNGGADIAYIKQQNTAALQEQQRAAAEQKRAAEQAAAEQKRIEEQQKQSRIAIRLDYADEATRIEEQLKTDILKINASGFSDEEQTAFINHAIERANFKSAQLKLDHDLQMQYAQQHEQTDAERISRQYALERREIELTVNYDAELRKAKIAAVNAAEQAALDELRYSYERELSAAKDYGLTDLQRIRAQFAQQRAELDRRTDIDDGQKSSLRDAMAGSEIYAVNQLQDAQRTAWQSQQADFGGTAQNFALAQQYRARLDVIQDALEAEVIAVEQAEQAKFDAQRKFELAAMQLTISSAEATAASFSASLKTMLGEQNVAYKIMFGAQQSLVMASAGLNMWDAYGDAMAEGATMSQKFAAAATIAAEFGRIITAASSLTLELPGYQVGGFTAAGRDTDAVGVVHANEFVANAETTRRYRPELTAMHNGTYDRRSNAPNINIKVSVTMDGKSSAESDSQYGKQIGQTLAAAINNEINKMTKPNGKLDKLYAKR